MTPRNSPSRPAICPGCKHVFQSTYRHRNYQGVCWKTYCSAKCRASILSKKFCGKNSWAWKGDNVSYAALHLWMRQNYPPPKECQRCGIVGKVDAANKSGKYLREISDWEWLCRKCHMIADGRMQRLIARNKQPKAKKPKIVAILSQE